MERLTQQKEPVAVYPTEGTVGVRSDSAVSLEGGLLQPAGKLRELEERTQQFLTATEAGSKVIRDYETPHQRTSIPAPQTTPRHSVSPEETFARFVHRAENRLSMIQELARTRMRQRYSLGAVHNIKQLVENALPDLDVLLFHGELGHVPVSWKIMPPGHWGRTIGGRPRHAHHLGPIRVELSESLLWEAEWRPDFIWGTLVHELLHVYALRQSPENELCLCGHKVAHGAGFYKAAVAAVKVLGIERVKAQSVVDYRAGCCHSEHDEQLIREDVARRLVESALTSEEQSMMFAYWASQRDGDA